MFTNIVLLVYVIYCAQELAIYALFTLAVNNALLIHNWKHAEQVLLDDGYHSTKYYQGSTSLYLTLHNSIMGLLHST